MNNSKTKKKLEKDFATVSTLGLPEKVLWFISLRHAFFESARHSVRRFLPFSLALSRPLLGLNQL